MKTAQEIFVESMQHRRKARVGHGNAVHVLTDFGALCGAGKNSKGTRWPSKFARLTDDAITCKKCIAQDAQDQVKLQEAANV